MGQELIVRIAYESTEIRDRLGAIAREIPFEIETQIALGSDSFHVEDCALLIFEQRLRPDGIEARTFSVSHANADMLCVVLVREPRSATESALLEAGAFDVIDDGPELRAQLARALAAAKRVRALQHERSRLTSDLAHREKLAALGTLAAGVGHEVNNPCGAILANSIVLRDDLEALLARPRFERLDAIDQLAPEWLESMSDCIAAARRIHQVVKSLGALSRRPDFLKPETIDVNEEIRLALRLVGKEVRFGANFEVSLDPELPPIQAPPSAIGQIVTNLVLNALQALDAVRPKNPWVGIRTLFDAQSILIEVGDNAGGVEPELLGRMFDPFFTTKPVGEGTGLGLPITRSLVERAGGEIIVESVRGSGTQFRVILPRDAGGSPRAHTTPVPPATDRMRVLIVDDDELTLRGIERSLRSHFECLTVTSADGALRLLREGARVDAVLTDVVMPGANGIGFFEELSVAHPPLADRILFISGGIVSPTLLDRVKQTGRPLLSKPVDPQEIVHLVLQLGRIAVDAPD